CCSEFTELLNDRIPGIKQKPFCNLYRDAVACQTLRRQMLCPGKCISAVRSELHRRFVHTNLKIRAYLFPFCSLSNGLAENPVADIDDESTVFRYGNEFNRAYQSPCGMLPANQGLSLMQSIGI